jgi:hypothetical protein
VTIGQEEIWLRAEAEKECARVGYDNFHRDFFRPMGDPGPGRLARVADVRIRSDKLVYRWERQKRAGYYNDDDTAGTVSRSIVVPKKSVLNVSAYTPGDFKIFYADPRTRADYLEWAPLLLEAEEYHAGNREVREPAVPKKRGPASWEAQDRYRKRKQILSMHGKAVRNRHAIETKGGKKYEAGLLWVASKERGGTLWIRRIDKNGRETKEYAAVSGMSYYDLEFEPGVEPVE